MNNCKYCGVELSPTMNCTGCGSSTGEVAGS
jgi:primosomal protein N'